MGGTCCKYVDSEQPVIQKNLSKNNKVVILEGFLQSVSSSLYEEMNSEQSRFKLIKKIGSGAFGQVILGEDTKSGERVALKFIERSYSHDFDGDGQEKRKTHVRREVLYHKMLSGHPNIIEFKEIFVLPSYLCIVMEYAEGGDLHTYVNERYFQKGRRMTEDEIRFWFRGLIFAAQHIKQLDIINRDIKLENCLIQRSADGTQTLKLCDFGFAKNLAFDSTPGSLVGSRPYVPPEVTSSRVGDQIEWRKRDIWSCGVCLYCLVYGRFPFDPTQSNSLWSFIKTVQEANVKFPGQPPISRELRELILLMLCADPSERIGVEEVISHKWFQSGSQVITPKINKSKNTGKQTDTEIQLEIDKAFEQRIGSAISDYMDELIGMPSEESP